MNSEEAKQVLDNLWPGEAERILRENMISPGEYHQFQKRQAQLLYERLYPITPSSESDFDHAV
jgi:hypothetical protein